MKKYVVIGGGIGGVSCAEELCRQICDHKIDARVKLLTNSDFVRQACNFVPVTENIQDFDISERSNESFSAKYPCLDVLQTTVLSIDAQGKNILCSDSTSISYDDLCICTGGSPVRLIQHPLVLGIRDNESIDTLRKKLKGSRRVALVGNGGIAMEVAEAIDFVQVTWVIKHSYVGSTFFDASASAFVLPCISRIRNSVNSLRTNNKNKSKDLQKSSPNKRDHSISSQETWGFAVGPEWVNYFKTMKQEDPNETPHESLNKTSLNFRFETIVLAIKTKESDNWIQVENIPPDISLPDIQTCCSDEWPIYLFMSNNEILGVDIVICAIGITPNTHFECSNIEKSSDGGILVNDRLQSVNNPHVYALGDCCTTTFSQECWFQMKLWTQARVMGLYAARSMLGQAEQLENSFVFELFSHVTNFFNYKVILLGCFNGQNLELENQHVIKHFLLQQGPTESIKQTFDEKGPDDREDSPPVQVLVRVTPEVEYVKFILLHGRLVGALLIGDTNLEETCENLILNQLDLSSFGVNLLDPEVDIEDYFD